MENKNKIYKYREFEFSTKKKTLEWRCENLEFVTKIFSELIDKETKQLSYSLIFPFLHNQENVKHILNHFLEGDISKIILNSEDDDDYYDLIILASEVLRDFFSSLTKKTNTSN